MVFMLRTCVGHGGRAVTSTVEPIPAADSGVGIGGGSNATSQQSCSEQILDSGAPVGRQGI